MSDLSDAQAALAAQIALAAANGGVSAYSQENYSITLRDPLKDLDLLDRLDERIRRTAGGSRVTQGEMVDPE